MSMRHITKPCAIPRRMGNLSVHHSHRVVARIGRQNGTVGANTTGASDEFKVRDGLLFNALQAADNVFITVTEIGDFKVITKLQKQ